MTKTYQGHKRAKHIDVCHHFVKEKVEKEEFMIWKLWILQSYSLKTRYDLTISRTLKQEGLILISLLCYHLLVWTLIESLIYPFEEQLLTATFLVTDSNRLLTQTSSSSLILLPCNTVTFPCNT